MVGVVDRPGQGRAGQGRAGQGQGRSTGKAAGWEGKKPNVSAVLLFGVREKNLAAAVRAVWFGEQGGRAGQGARTGRQGRAWEEGREGRRLGGKKT